MCKIFAQQPAERYAPERRSVRLSGHSTSVCLERFFWEILEEIAARDGVSVPKFLSILHDEVLEFRGDVTNFASLLRCACLTYVATKNEAGISEAISLGTKRDLIGAAA
jgi:predicted DNA-binding ribbon-helix-helix protein